MATWQQTGAQWFVEDTGESCEWTPAQRAAQARALERKAGGAAGALDKAAAAAVAADARRVLSGEANEMRAIASRADHHSLGGAPAIEAKRSQIDRATALIGEWAGY